MPHFSGIIDWVFIEQPLALPESAPLIVDLPDKIPTIGKMNQIFEPIMYFLNASWFGVSQSSANLS